ncbi:hypothetical protein [Streptomyces boncukensis]|uniref:DUF8094 domain-containing protein n=1 Tax=Streptomyces boncukensis TaxID=2711219 RepID=A0A6G4XA55_9ACTN|nr:hypothetical protein [Streptomyces boncukensis]NGO73541.1 hypothetical protein [Streptomyces boncukensis]
MPGHRAKTAARGLALAAALTASLAGCMTVHGETAVVPAISKPEAAKVLKDFTAENNRANRAYDPKRNAAIETGALGAIDQAALTSRRELRPQGNPKYRSLKLTDTHYLIPQQAGWPKFFVTNSASNREGDGRWFFVFQRDGADAPWKASYLAILQPDEIPRFAADGDGYARPVPTDGGSGLTVPPERLSRAYTRYLQDGAGDTFASGRYTTQLRAQREERKKRKNVRNEYADQAAGPPQFAPFGLRTRDGGALVFFASHHHHKQTLPRGYRPRISNPLLKALMTGTPKQSVTLERVAGQAVAVPPGKKGGKVVFLNRIRGLTAAKGE